MDVGGGGGRRGALGGVVERGGVQKNGFASGSTLYYNFKSASAAARLGDATLDAGAARAFGFLPNMTSASGLGLNNPLHGSLSASTIFASGPGINTFLPNAAYPSPAACPHMQ